MREINFLVKWLPWATLAIFAFFVYEKAWPVVIFMTAALGLSGGLLWYGHRASEPQDKQRMYRIWVLMYCGCIMLSMFIAYVLFVKLGL